MEAVARDVQAKGRLQPWSSTKADGQAWWKLPRRNWKVLGVVGLLGQTAGSNALTREGYVQAKEGFRGFRGFRGLKPGKRQARMP